MFKTVTLKFTQNFIDRKILKYFFGFNDAVKYNI